MEPVSLENVVSLRAYREKKRAGLLKSSPPSIRITTAQLKQYVDSEIEKQNVKLRDIYKDYNTQVDSLIARQDSLLKIIKQVINKTKINLEE